MVECVRLSRFPGDDYFKKGLPVRVERTGNIFSIDFFKQKEDQEKKETLCTLSIIPTSPLQQVYPHRLEPSSSQETSLNIAENSKLWKKVPTVLQLLPIVGDLGDRWHELGIALKLEKSRSLQYWC
ncbi:hypothetical protein OS493_022011 [Desmophyllum pertusum]|uniref:Uncharacterized protein n=1 Tax=Desmophyllum pertusum TaxID=174260 RepID=A0A9W9Z069_9CNID|nr:hypothetical protein OS493_022011 [Desmophyllum pertusum]